MNVYKRFSIYLTISITLCITAFTTTFAAVYRMPPSGSDIVGKVFTVKAQRGDTLKGLGKRHGIGYHEMLEANAGVKPNRLYLNQEIVIPALYLLPNPRYGIIINVAELRLYYFTPDNKYVYTYPVGLGRSQWRTPTSSTSVINKKPDPTWWVPESIRDDKYYRTGKMLPKFIPPGPENPLGHYAIYLGESGYLIHGTNNPYSIGTYASSGCIRMQNEDVEVLYNIVPVGTPVKIAHLPLKTGWHKGRLYLESHVAVEDYLNEPPSRLNVIYLDDAINYTNRYRGAKVNWKLAERIDKQKLGIPQPIN